MIQFENIHLSFDDRKILNNVSFSVNAGQAVLLAGNSGVGKSTVLKLILGLLHPDAGKVKIFGKYISHAAEKQLLKIRRQCGIVFQGGALFDSLTVQQNVGFFLRENLSLPEAEVMGRVVKILQYLGLHEQMNYYPAQLSGGMKKRVAIARAIVAGPKILLYDEPTAGLDPIAAKRVVKLIQRLNADFNITSVIVSHEIHYFLDTIQRMLLLREGEISYDGYPAMNVVQDVVEEEYARLDNFLATDASAGALFAN